MRGFLITIVVAALLFGVIAWSRGMFSPTAGDDAQADGHKSTPKKDWGPRLKGEKTSKEVPIAAGNGADPIVIPSSRLAVIDEGDVPGRQDGKLMFIGEPVNPGDEGFNENRFFEIPNALPIEELVLLPIPYNPKRFFEGPNRQKMERIYFRPLKDDSRLKQDQIVAVMDPTLAYTKVGIGKAKLTASVSDWNGAEALYKVYQEELERLDKIKARDPKGVSEQEYNVARAQRDKYKAERDSKKEAIRVADEELREARTQAALHFLRNTVVPSNGAAYNPSLIRIKNVYKKSGESVKNLDPVLHAYNLGWLRAEGLLDGQYLTAVHENMAVTVEPTVIRMPVRTLHGHRQAITCVAVSSDTKTPFIVTGSDDSTVRVWKRNLPTEFCVLPHPAPVRAVACSPKKAEGNHCLTACADGSVRLWDLDKLSSDSRTPNKPVWEHDSQHTDAINCIAFSPDGSMYATGGDDNAINLWKTKTGTLIYRFDDEMGHQGAVTSLHFTPDLQVISAGRDNTVRVWTLCEKGADMDQSRLLSNRSGSVTSLGVDPQGRWMLFDQGRKLQVISRLSGRTVGLIQDPGESSPFENLAEFSPDASLVLTTSASEGRVQLWRAPTDGSRSYEVRQLKAKDSGPVSCAAFGVDTTLPETRAEDAERFFAVTGTRDGLVHVWAVPGKEHVANKLKGKVSLRDAFVDPSTGQARIWVDVDNKDDRLRPGDSVTVVVEPQAKK
jgi:WD40 repeat protein